MNQYEGRNIDLANRLNTHLEKLTGQRKDYYSVFTLTDLVALKTVLADINNVLTYKTTIQSAKWICKFFKLDKKNSCKIIQAVDGTKPNTKGFDIFISGPINIIAEVKCISPVNNGGSFGSAQGTSLMKDFCSLKNGKGSLKDTNQYYKFLFLLDLGQRTDNAIQQLLRTSRYMSSDPSKQNFHEVKEHIEMLPIKAQIEELSLDKIYLKTIKIDQ